MRVQCFCGSMFWLFTHDYYVASVVVVVVVLVVTVVVLKVSEIA